MVLSFLRWPHHVAAAVPAWAETGGTERDPGDDDRASEPAAGAATAAGCPATTHRGVLLKSKIKLALKNNEKYFDGNKFEDVTCQ